MEGNSTGRLILVHIGEELIEKKFQMDSRLQQLDEDEKRSKSKVN